MGPTARFSAVLGPWCARAEVRAALVRDQVFLKSSNHRERDERERERDSQRPELESELISWHAVHLVVYSSLALSFSFSFLVSLPL